MKSADLCAFFSTILSNEYVTLRRTNGFKEPLGLTFFRDMSDHMTSQFKWSTEEEDVKYFGMDPNDPEKKEK